jgi:uroporphyrinogen III methyltransferase/synthase
VGTELGGAQVASIGPVTSAAAREAGLPVDLEAAEHTVAGLLAVIRAAFTRAVG